MLKTLTKIFRTILSWFGYILSLYLAIYALETTARKEPLLLERKRIQIYDPSSVYESKLSIVDAENKKIDKPVTAVELHFINNGEIAINGTDIKSPIKLYLKDKESKIIDFQINNITKESNNFSISSENRSHRAGLIINFDYLNPKDGASFKIFFEGNPKSLIEVEGDIVNAKIGRKPFVPKTLLISRFLWHLAILLILLIILFLVIFILTKITAYILNKLNSVNGKFKWLNSDNIEASFYIVFYLTFILVLAYHVFVQTYENLNSTEKIVPTILLEK